MNEDKDPENNLIPYVLIFTLVLANLKLFGFIQISWWWVFCLFWFYGAMILFWVFVFLIILLKDD